MELSESKYLDFVEVEQGEKITKHFEVQSKSTNDCLGEIKWFGRWRQYCFFPASFGTVFNATCLKDITDFINSLMEERRLKKSVVTASP